MLRVCFVGPTGSGKTTLLGSLIEDPDYLKTRPTTQVPLPDHWHGAKDDYSLEF
jgi:GTPase SAR1 family protein